MPTAALARGHPDSIANHGIDDVTSHYAAIIGGLPTKPVLIGRSFGGMIAERLLGEDHAAAAIAIDAAQIKGVLPLPLSSLRSTLPVFRNLANKHLAVSLTAEQFRYSFGNAIAPGESDALFQQWTIPAPGWLYKHSLSGNGALAMTGPIVLADHAGARLAHGKAYLGPAAGTRAATSASPRLA